MTYEIEVRIADPLPLAVVRRSVQPAGVALAWRPALDLVWAFIRPREGLWAGGHNVFVYHRPAIDGEPMTVEFGVQVTRTFDGNGDVQASQTPSGRVVSTTHVGPIDRLVEAYAALDGWVAEHREVAAGISWETYGDWTADPAANNVELTYLLQEARDIREG